MSIKINTSTPEEKKKSFLKYVDGNNYSNKTLPNSGTRPAAGAILNNVKKAVGYWIEQDGTK